ncbi:MAG: hypothetical protein ABEI52_00100, partial [Halobacteriaceae archaeon]
EAVLDLLPSVSEQLSDMFDEHGHLSSTMEYPVTGEYVPCLLAVWADREGYGIEYATGDDVVMVFDEEKINSEVETVIRYNIDDNEERSFAELRENYLAAPVPDTVIRAAAEKTDEPITITDTGLRKSGGE